MGRFLTFPLVRGEGGGFWRRAPLSHLAHPPTFLETGGLPLYPPAGAAPPAPHFWGTRVLLRPAPSFSRGSGLVALLCRPLRPPTFSRTRGLAVPPAGAALPAPWLGGRRRRRLLTWRDGTLPDLSPGTRAGTGELPRGEGASFDCMLVTPISRISGFAGTKPLQRHYEALQAVTQSLRSRYGVGWLQRACALQRHSLRSQPSSDGLAPWGVPSAPLPQGDSLWLAPSTYVMRQAPRKRSGPGAHFMGTL